MRSEWATPQPLSALLAQHGGSIKTGPFGTTLKASEYAVVGVPLISVREIGHGSFRVDAKTPRVDAATISRLPEYILEEGDIVFARKGGIERCALVRKQQAGWFLGSDGIRLRPPKTCDARFLAYSLQTPAVKEWLIQHSTGSTMASLNQSTIGRLPVSLPSASTQRTVADTLEVFDQRIDLLRQTNGTIESIAQALFKSWFIDFDPVRAKAQGREPEGMDAETAALFPAEFEESALGSIPKGWQVSRLAEHVSADRGLSYKGAGLREAGEGIPMHNLNSVLEGGGYKYAGIKYYSGDFKDRHAVFGGEVIVANTEQGHEHRLIGFPAVVPMRYEYAIFSHHIYRIRLKPDSPLTVHTLYFTLMAQPVREQVIGCANGSTVNMLKVAGLEMPQFVCPSRAVAKAFESIAQILRQQLEANVERIEVLTELRDTLLPRLISGKLRLPEAQAHVDEMVA